VRGRLWPLLSAGVVALAMQALVVPVVDRAVPTVVPGVRVAVNAVPPGTPGAAVARLQLRQLGARAAVPLRAGPYVRGVFGVGWGDADGDGCSTREEVWALWAEGDAPRDSCGVDVMVLDPYTGNRMSTSMMEPDHVVSLAEAWSAGAWGWSAAERVAFANDVVNLVPTARWLAQSRGDGVGGVWRPPNEWYWCTYTSAYVGTKYLYSLTVTPEEVAWLSAGLDFCAGPWDAHGR
jgi:hypothetical protein